jgi:hypothetical protein
MLVREITPQTAVTQFFPCPNPMLILRSAEASFSQFESLHTGVLTCNGCELDGFFRHVYCML